MTTTGDPRLGTELAGYRIEALIGRGGMGVVYRARDLALERPVALKILSPQLASDAGFRARFLTESRLAASLDHPNVIPVYDAGEWQGELYIAMRYVEGQDLKALLAAGPLEPERALRLVSQVADALDAAHARGLVHRDVKPSNVLVAEHEHVYLADFGLTRRLGEAGAALGAAQSLGTIDYVAPEQIRGDELDGRADLYSLGCLLQECLSGEPPFRRSSEAATLYAHLEEEPQAPPGLEQVMGKALAKDPAERYQTGAELVSAARSALGLEPKRARWPIVIAAALSALLVAGGLLGYFLTRGSGGPVAEPGADSLVRIDPKTNTVTETMPVGRKASGVAAAGDYVWVTNAGDGTVWRIDPKTRKVLQITARGTPTGIAVGRSALVADGPEHSLAAIDQTSGTVSYVTKLPGSPNAHLQVAAGAEGVWFADPTERIVGTVEVGARGGTPSKQVLIPPDRRSLVSAYEAFNGLAVGEGSVWVAGDAFGRTVWRVDPASGSVAAVIRLPFVPKSIAAGEGAVWVTSLLDDTVSRIDPATGRITATIHVGRGVDGIAVGEGAVWVTSSIDGTVSRIDPKTDKVVATVPVGSTTGQIAAGAGGVWVTAARQPAAPPPGAIKIGVLSDCTGPLGQNYDETLAGAELPLIARGGILAGSTLTDGVKGVSIGGRPVRLLFGCADGTTASALVEARRLVEKAGVDILIGPLSGEEGLVLQEYVRRHPGVAFVNGTASAPQLHPPRNSYSFHTDGAGFMAGLGNYAYRTLGWRTAVTVADEADPLFNWSQTAGFDAEFCSLGGVVVKRIWVPPATQDYSSVIAQIPGTGVDGFFTASDQGTVLALANGYPGLRGNIARKMLVGGLGLGPAMSPKRISKRISGIVVSGPFVGSGPAHALNRYLVALHKAFPRLGPYQRGLAFDLQYHDAMAATLKALDASGGDLSGGEQRFMRALSKVELDAPNGHIRLDRNHQAIAPSYLYRMRTWSVGHLYRTIPEVESTFGGYFKPSDTPPGKTTPVCRKGNPPPWAKQ